MTSLRWVRDFLRFIRQYRAERAERSHVDKMNEFYTKNIGRGGRLIDSMSYLILERQCHRYGIKIGKKNIRELELELLKARREWGADI